MLMLNIKKRKKKLNKNLKKCTKNSLIVILKFPKNIFSQQFLNQVCYLLGSLPVASDHVGTTRC